MPVVVNAGMIGCGQIAPLSHSDQVSRGIGVADMAQAIISDRPHRTSADLAIHVLDVMQAVTDASQQNQHMMIASTCERPAPLAEGLALGEIAA